jgi:hypothetical protein
MLVKIDINTIKSIVRKATAFFLAVTFPLWIVPYCIFSRIIEGTYEMYKDILWSMETTVVVTMPKDKPNEDASHLKPEGNHNLVLNGGLKARGGTQVTDANGTSVYFMEPITAEYNNKVEMSVGKDNRLWIKVDEEWKRVAIES